MWQSIRSSSTRNFCGRRGNDDNDNRKVNSSIEKRNEKNRDNENRRGNGNDNSSNSNNDNDKNNENKNNDDNGEEGINNDSNECDQSFHIRLSKALSSIDKDRENIHTPPDSSYQMTSSSETQSLLNRMVLAPRILPLRSKENNIEYSTEYFNDNENNHDGGRFIVRTSDSSPSVSSPRSSVNFKNTTRVKFWVPIGSDSTVILEFCYFYDTDGNNPSDIDGFENTDDNDNNINFESNNSYNNNNNNNSNDNDSDNNINDNNQNDNINDEI